MPLATKAAAAVIAGMMTASLPAAAQLQKNDPAQQMVTPLTPRDYVHAAAMADMFELRSSRIALDKAQRSATTEFAERMLSDHGKTRDMVKNAAASAATPDLAGAALPEELDEKHAALMEELRNAGASEFDETYLDIQVQAHQEALNLHRTYAETGEVGPLREVAREAARIVEGHLQTVQRLTGARGAQDR